MIKKRVFILAVAAIGLFFWQPWSSKDNTTGTPPGVSAPRPQAPAQTTAADTHSTPDKAPQAPSLPAEFYQQRERIVSALNQALACQDTGECASSADDPRAAMFEQERRLVDELKTLQDLYAAHQFEDEQLARITADFLESPSGRVQFQALQMMQQQSPNVENATVLLQALDDSYDAKVVESALTELQRYPTLNTSIDELLIKNLQTGSFYVSRTIAQNIQPFLSSNNLSGYEALLDKLPAQTAKARLLNASINAYKKSVRSVEVQKNQQDVEH